MLLSHNIMREIKKSQRNNSNLTYLIIKGMLTNEYRITKKKNCIIEKWTLGEANSAMPLSERKPEKEHTPL